MSLGGIAIAIGTLVDAAIVMIENVHKKLEHEPDESDGAWRRSTHGCREVGPSLFFSLMIVALSFLPVFTLEAQEGRLFAPLAYTKTYAMVAASLLSITLVPVLIWYLVRGRIRPEHANPVNRAATAAYRPLLEVALRHPVGRDGRRRRVLIAGDAVARLAARHASSCRELDEGDLLYMPTTLPGPLDGRRARAAAADRPADQDGARGRARLRQGRPRGNAPPIPRRSRCSRRRSCSSRATSGAPGMTPEKLKAELDALVKFPGRVERLGATRSRPASTCSPPASARRSASRSWVRTSRPSSSSASRSRRSCKAVPGTTSVYAERTATGRYVDIDIDRVAAGALRAQHQGRAGHRRQRRGRHDRQLHRRGPRALPDQPALSAGLPRLAREAARSCRS